MGPFRGSDTDREEGWRRLAERADRSVLTADYIASLRGWRKIEPETPLDSLKLVNDSLDIFVSTWDSEDPQEWSWYDNGFPLTGGPTTRAEFDAIFVEEVFST